jgi:CO dehydrogenase nickel-insertion accessory protein CooC1
MVKDNSNANGDGTSADVHLVLNGKGGVGKSLVATWLAEFLISRGRSVRCIDGDPVNRSLSHQTTPETHQPAPVTGKP